MKQKFKPILLITLFVIMLAAAFVPTKSYAGTRLEPGILKPGKYGLGCQCPVLIFFTCGCEVFVPQS